MKYTGFVVDLVDTIGTNYSSNGMHLRPWKTDRFDKVSGFTLQDMENALIKVGQRGNRDIRACGFDWWRYYIAGHNHCAWELYKYWDSWKHDPVIIGGKVVRDGYYTYKVSADSPCRDNGYVATAARQTTSTSDTGWICGGIVGNEDGEEDPTEERLIIPRCPPQPPRRGGCGH